MIFGKRKSFGYVLSHSNRKIVVHHTHVLKDKILEAIQPNDLIFFDDCLFSQYSFIKQHRCTIENLNAMCIIGFSSGLVCAEEVEESEQIESIESKLVHDRCNALVKSSANLHLLDGDWSLKCFMKVSQIEELLNFENVYVALHGCCHLNLEKMFDDKLDQLKIFKEDTIAGKELFKSRLGFSPSIYVHPYAYAPPLARVFLDQIGCIYQFADGINSRIPVEEIA